VAVTAKLYWHRLLVFLHIRKDEPESNQPEATQTSDSA
jgi:hypothetical protein